MISPRKISLPLALGVALPLMASAQTPPAPASAIVSSALEKPAKPLPKTAAEWAARLILYAQTEEPDDNILHEFGYIAPEIQLAALRDCWKKLTKEQERAHLMEVVEAETAGQADYEPDDAPVSEERVNPLLLDILTFGATDDSADVQKRTWECLTEIAGRKFSDAKEFQAWRKAQGDKSLTEITRANVTALFAQFAKADDKSRPALYETLTHFVFVSESRAAENHPIGGANAIKLTAVRRRAALASGLLDALALRLHKPANGLESAEIAAMLIAFQPDDAYMARIEPDMKRELPALAAAPTGQDEPGVSTLVVAVTLLSRYRSEWAVTALNRIVENTYSTPSVVEMVNGLTGSRSPRVIPILIPLLETMPADLQTSALETLAKLTRVPGGAKHTMAWWRDWLTKNASALPENVRDLPLPKLKNGLEFWVARLTTAPTLDSVDYAQRDAFARLDSALQLEILRAVLPKIANENLRRDLIALATTAPAAQSEDDRANLKPFNAHLLEILDLGANDAAPSAQQQAFSTAGDIALQTFADKESYAAWRKQTEGKSLEEVVLGSAKTMAAQFQAADAAGKMERFEPLLRVAYITSRNAQTAQSVTTHTVTASGLEKIRRDAFQQAGLPDTMALLLHDSKTPELAVKALSFLGAFQPDDAFLQKIEPDVRALLEAQIAQEEAVPDNAASLIFRYRGAWVLPLVAKWTLRDYLTPGFDALNSALTDAADVRTLPILIALSETMGKNDANALLVTASSITGVVYDPAHDGAWWRQWWEKNRVKYPAEIRDLKLTGLKTGVAALEDRIAFHSEQYGMDYRTRNQFSELEPEAKYKVMREMWGRDLSDAVKSMMLMTLSEWQNGVSQLESNPHLLDEIHLGMMDEEPQTQQQATTLLCSLTLQTFSDTDDYLAWRKRSAGKTPTDLVSAGATAFVAQFKKANEARKIELLQQAQQAQFQDGFSVEVVGGKPVETVQAKGLTDIRRKAVIAAGLPEAVAALAQSNDAAAVVSAANFLSNFHPGASYLANMESGVQRVYAKMLANPDEDPALSLDLILQYHGAWVGEALSKFVQKMYLRPNGENTLRMMFYSRDPRSIPLMISLIDSVSDNDRQQIMRQLSELTKVAYDASHDSAWWRNWWKTNRDKQPAEAQAIELLDLKKGQEIVVARLTASKQDTDWNVLQMFDALDAETQYAILRDNWKKIGNEQTRVNLIERACNENGAGQGNNAAVAPQDRPHLFDIIALGVADTSEQVRNDALGFASNVAVRKIKDAADFAAWRKVNGDKPLTEIVRANTLDLVERMKRADAKTLPGLLDESLNLQWYSSVLAGDGLTESPWKVRAIGAAAVRRKAAFDAGLPEKIAEWLKPTNSPEIEQSALNLAVQFLPGREFMRTIEPDVERLVKAKKPKEDGYDFFLTSILDNYNSKWATDVLLATVKAQYANHVDEMIALLTNSRDARVIPSLISALADVDEQSWQRQPVNQALARLTHTGSGASHSADWWRDWWKRNHTALPDAAQAEAFPNFQSAKVAQEYSVRRTRKQVSIGGDPKRSYWFVTSGLLLNRKLAAKTAANPAPVPPADFSDIPAASRPGLLVVLSTGDADGAETRYWQNLVGKNFGGKYLAAVVVAPQWSAKQTPLWLTGRDRNKAKGASFTTETFAAQIVKDIEAKYPVNPARVFLIGAGAGGQATYACSLQQKTPFAGFALIGSPFHPADLPPFTFAKGRRYYLLRSPDDKQTPLFLAQAARDTLQKAGANVTLVPYAIDPDAAQKATRDTVASGIKWLETK